jgi:hypothetical protein
VIHLFEPRIRAAAFVPVSLLATFCLLVEPAAAGTPVNVTTYHVDTMRTGWNSHEYTLKTSNVNASAFGLVKTVPLDAQVDAQPLVLGSEQFTAGSQPGTYSIAYVVTEGDSVYAIDTSTGTILGRTVLGTPVPQSALPGQCNNNAQSIGITSTPVIESANHVLYVIADTYTNKKAAFQLHALDTRTLADTVAPVTVVASHPLSNGQRTTFNATSSRQRSALLETNGTIYAAFSSYCDQDANSTRGWLLGWQASTLTPIPSSDLTDTFSSSPGGDFLDSIWMSGAGPASDESGSLYFVTSNSDASTYDGVHDIQESVVRESAKLTTIQSIFTPSDQPTLDDYDNDFGSGGILLLPYQSGGTIHTFAAAAGKDGNLYFLDRDKLGGFSSSGNNVLGTYSVGACWCAPSYYVGSDGIPRVVTSGGSQVGIWQVQTSPSPALVHQSSSTNLSTGQDGGFFTTISSAGTTAGSAIVWAVSRPTDSNPSDVILYAFDPTTASLLYSSVAGTWPNVNGDSDLVPVVANGRVLVASYQQLAIFGKVKPGAQTAAIMHFVRPAPAPLPAGTHEIYGRIVAFRGTTIAVAMRSGRIASIDVDAAHRTYATTELYRGEPILVRFKAGPTGTFVATTVQHAKSSPALWAPDR